jgi:hypothetical protein
MPDVVGRFVWWSGRGLIFAGGEWPERVSGAMMRYRIGTTNGARMTCC